MKKALFYEKMANLYAVKSYKPIDPNDVPFQTAMADLFEVSKDLLTDEEFTHGYEQALLQCDRVPTMKELVRLAKGGEEGVAQDAWQLFLKGAKGEDVDDAIVQAFAASHGGFYILGFKPEEELAYLRSPFVKYYASALNRQRMGGNSAPAIASSMVKRLPGGGDAV